MKKVKARNLEQIKKYVNYRKKGLSYHEIEVLMKKNRRQFVRWNDYLKRGLDLSTV